MTAPFAEDSLWIKARLFINRAMDSGQHRNFDEQALWASLSLELLAKAALSRVSPLLIASPSEDGTNLLMASGLVQGDPEFRSIPAKTLFTRCARAFRPFSLKEASTISSARNEYLHGGTASISGLPPHAWWPRFWAQAAILLTAQDREIEEFVGPDRVSVVKRHLESNRQHVEDRVTALIERAKQRLGLHQAGRLTAHQEAEWAASANPSAGLSYRGEATCPACGSTGTLEGESVLSHEMQLEELGDENFDTWVELTIGSDYFSCATCHLVLDGYELVKAAGLDEQFAAVDDTDDYLDEPEYGND